MKKEIVKIVLPYAVLNKETYINEAKEIEIANNEKHVLNIFTNSTKVNAFIDAIIATGKVSAEQRKEHFAKDMKKNKKSKRRSCFSFGQCCFISSCKKQIYDCC